MLRVQGEDRSLEGKHKEWGVEVGVKVELKWGESVRAGGGERKGRRECSQSLHTPTFITGWVVQVKGTGGVVQGRRPFHPGDRPSCPPDLLLSS